MKFEPGTDSAGQGDVKLMNRSSFLWIVQTLSAICYQKCCILVKTYFVIIVNNFGVCLQNVSVSSGMRAGDLEKLKLILQVVPEVEYICLDVANGYSEHFVEFVKQVRKEFPRHTIMVYKYYLCFFYYSTLMF